MSLILASASPRRRQLLTVLGIPFCVQTADIDEGILPDESPLAHARRLAKTKALTVATRVDDAVVLAADTIVVQHGRILGKPRDAAEARHMLQSLRDAPHQVITAVAVTFFNPSTAWREMLTSEHVADVIMRPYTDSEIEAYIATGDPLDKAGAYAIQHPQFRPVARYEGCFASIMGLPLALVAELLIQAGFTPDPHWPQRCHRLTGHCCHHP
ncbi:MAG: septum formation protein Maf [Chloroflexi bacterium]|nr:septum formation protein Maf [Chloroflexota bacterium]